MTPPRLPPQNIWLSLPALTADQAEVILDLVDELQRLLWEIYGDAVIDYFAEASAADPPWESHDDDDGPDF
ncbi:MAG: hypothetical protein ACREKH_04905 [Candidatus Rokuibacteriota bacterium]